MAQARNNPQSTDSGADGTSLTLASYAINTVVNARKVVVAGCGYRDNTDVIPKVSGVTFAGNAMTQIAVKRTQTNVYCSLWAIAVGADTAAADVVATWDAACTSRKLGVVTLIDTTQVIPSDSLVDSGNTGGTNILTLTGTAPAGNSLGIMACSISVKQPAVTELGQVIFIDRDSTLGNLTLSDRASTGAGSFSLGIERADQSSTNKAGVMGIFAEDLGGAPPSDPIPGALMMVGI